MAARACGVLQHEFFPILWPDPDEMALSEKFRIPNTSRFAKLRIGGTMKNIIKRIAGLACVASFAWAGAALAETYPSRPIIMVVPFAAGGPTDTLARIVAEGMRQSLGQTIIVENTTGAAGSIAVGRVARAAPDGYTLSIGHWSTHVVNGAIYPLSYDLPKDLEPVALPQS